MSGGGSLAAAGGSLRVGVLGAAGQVGRCLVRAVDAAPDLALAFALTRTELDLGEPAAIDPWLDRQASLPDVVLNAAAYTKVDACESQVELAHRLNAQMPGEWARALAARGIRFVHLSTDYVFPGDGSRPYREDDPTGPRSVYGETKRAGEQLVLGRDPEALVVRTSWVFGPGRNFVLAILDQAARRRGGERLGPLQVVDDQQGSPTAAADLAEGLLALCRLRAGARAEIRGIVHLCNAGVTTWFRFAREILDQAGYPELHIDPVATGSFPTAARRPAYSVLDCHRAQSFGVALRPWQEALAGYLAGPDRPTHLISPGGSPGPAPAASESASSGSPSGSPRDASASASSEPVRRKVSH